MVLQSDGSLILPTFFLYWINFTTIRSDSSFYTLFLNSRQLSDIDRKRDGFRFFGREEKFGGGGSERTRCGLLYLCLGRTHPRSRDSSSMNVSTPTLGSSHRPKGRVRLVTTFLVSFVRSNNSQFFNYGYFVSLSRKVHEFWMSDLPK